MKTLHWITIIFGILYCCFWIFVGISVFVQGYYLIAPLYGLLVGYILKDVISDIKALSTNNGSSHEKSE